MKDSFVFILAFILFTVAFSNHVVALKNVPREDTVIFDAYGKMANPRNFNWMVPGTSRSQGMHQTVWEPLFILNYETTQIEPFLGRSFTSNDNMDIWTLKIRKDVTWADGEVFDADDIIFTIDTLLKDGTKTLAEAANMQQWIADIKKIDDSTVQFDLKSPNPRFQLDYFSVRVWGNVVILPEHIWKDKDPFTFDFYDPSKGWPFGTGPYQLVSANENEFVYDRRDDWWGAKADFQDLPVPKRLIWIVTGVEENRSLLVADSQLDSVGGITLGAFEAIQAINRNVIAWKNRMPFVWLDPCPRQMSLNHTIEPWNSPDMRKALSLIIDRQQIVEIAYEGTSIPSKTIFVEYAGMEPYISVIKNLWIDSTADVKSGQMLIETNGWRINADGFYQKNGKLLSINIQTHEAGIELRRVADVIVEQLRIAGVHATTRAIAGSTWNDNKAFGNFEAVIDWDACGSVNEPWITMNRYTTQFYRTIDERVPSLNNFVRWTGPKAETYSQIVSQIGILPLGDPTIDPLFAEAMEIYMSEQVTIPLTQAVQLVPFDTTYWVGWPTARNNFIQPATWWMSAHRIIHHLRKAKN
ncbi:TPA: ABC transporter substrate-binding protein [Candidatus Poribacteria bacterium]|nr:ABC transporter substrate-binding protein [Candidatus Poribacteria bacterium]HIC01595.1 ABC transporter substrate-binding protein [Candidatus Poribacteria bacterium]HIN30063.1 ABC transporter substrate-binding protein [Candidatus Poribacteria bacterium]HIO08541.1 ABC transporter substrate-binding protein [Candidatus Poribacteria bacterium]HIO46422.1 ABC transporter substrate-binding protein [Candidatus Poribacteria bacterium]